MINKFYSLLVYDDNKQLIYTKYNFDFEKYKTDFNLLTNNKVDIYENFYKRNNYEPSKPYIIYDNYKKYFLPITEEIKAYVDKYGVFHRNYLTIVSPNYDNEYIISKQFDLVEYTEKEVRRIQDYFYSNGTEYTFTKYNFNFDLYEKNFKIYNNKLVKFTDFVLRCYRTSGVILGTTGYGIAEWCKEYFITNINLSEYLLSSSIYSILEYEEKNFFNIDFQKYINNNADLNNLDIEIAKEHYLRNGQFELRNINLFEYQKTSIEKSREGICTIFLKNKIDSPLATGFLYNYNDTNKYIITCYHIIKNYRDQRYIHAIFENNNQSTIAQFKIIGYDITSDIMVAIYDHTLNFNIVNNVNIYQYPSLIINNSYKTKVSEKVSLIGNISYDDNLSFIAGNVMNINYSGGFNIGPSADTIPESILIQTYGTPGMSGSPILRGDPLDINILECIGMLLGALKDTNQVMVAIDGYLLDNIVQNIIANWNLFTNILGITDQLRIDNFVKNGYEKSWLGITNQYNHPILSKVYKELSNLSYVGGLLITNFIIGFNVRDEQFVYSSNDLIDRNVIKFEGPLINSKLYNRFITNGNIPIVIKSITFFDSINCAFRKIDIGKFGNQKPYSNYVYGQSYIASYELPDIYYNNLKYEFAPITIEYFYYDGDTWTLDSEKIGDNTKEWYVTYDDNTGNKYFQHKFEFPEILIPYIHNYSISRYAINSIESLNRKSRNLGSQI